MKERSGTDLQSSHRGELGRKASCRHLQPCLHRSLKEGPRNLSKAGRDNLGNQTSEKTGTGLKFYKYFSFSFLEDI